MNHDEIITFLEIIQQGSITKAAANLYVSQGTASARIQSLEQQLKISLFYRQQGIRNITLTPQGEQFFKIAQQYVSLCDQANRIQYKSQFQNFNIACSDSINRLLSNTFYQDFYTKYPQIILSIQTEHATQIYEMIETQRIDFGIAQSLHTNKNVIAKPLYSEELVLLYHKNSLIDPHNEIHINYSFAYKQWYQKNFPDSDHPKITIGTQSMLESFIQEKDAWAIVPKSIANSFCTSNLDLTYKQMKNPFICTTYYYHHINVKPWVNPIIELFLSELQKYLKQQKAL